MNKIISPGNERNPTLAASLPEGTTIRDTKVKQQTNKRNAHSIEEKGYMTRRFQTDQRAQCTVITNHVTGERIDIQNCLTRAITVNYTLLNISY